MAQTTARKTFNFAIEIGGVDQLLIQTAKKPEVEIGAVAHGATNHDIKTAGGIAVSDAELQKIKPAETGDRWAFDWMSQAQSLTTGYGSLPQQYKRDIVFKELAPNGATINAWLWEGAWVRKVSDSESKRGNQNENIIETVTISVDRVIPLF